MRGCILQPGYLPWLGFFEQWAFAEMFIFLDDVQYTKQDWRNRNRIRSGAAQGWSWLTVPVKTSSSHIRVGDVQIDYGRNWVGKHLNLLQENYRHAPFFDDVFALIRRRLERRSPLLCQLNIDLVVDVARYLSLERRWQRSSSLDIGAGDKNERLIAICQAAGIDWFYDGQKAASFLDGPRFERAGIRVDLQNYDHPVYPQTRQPFVAFLSVVDLLFACGPASADVLVRSPLVAAALAPTRSAAP